MFEPGIGPAAPHGDAPNVVAPFQHLQEALDVHHFGDSWRHWIKIEAQVPLEDGIKYPICVDGARHRPPEDVGGPHGYAEFLKAWCDPTHHEHRAMRTWAGRAFDPEIFDFAKRPCPQREGKFA